MKFWREQSQSSRNVLLRVGRFDAVLVANEVVDECGNKGLVLKKKKGRKRKK